MSDYWEMLFCKEGALWKDEPSDSAIRALELFKLKDFKKILIPGFGYGRNAKLFYNNGLNVTRIEISQSAIRIARKNGLKCTIHHGSVMQMPFDNNIYDAIF